MSSFTRRFTPALVVLALGLGAVSVWAAEPNQQELQNQIQSLQAKVAAMEAKQLTAADVDATVQKVLADADRRSQLLAAEGFTAGYSNGKFLIQSADGSFVLNPTFQLQLRYVTNSVDPCGDDDIGSGFEIRRMKFAFEGNAFTPDLTYKFQWETVDTDRIDPEPGTVRLQDAWVKYKFADQWAVKGGQFIDPVIHEQLVNSKYQLAAERSMLSNMLGLTSEHYVQGISLIYDDQQLRAEVALHDGILSQNTTWEDTVLSSSDVSGFSDTEETVAVDFGVSARVEYLVFGKYKDYQDFTAMGVKDDLLVIGAGCDWSQGSDNNLYLWTADAQWKNTQGTSVYVAALGSFINTRVGNESDEFCNWGGLVQVGQMLNDEWEVFGRWSYTVIDQQLADEGVDRFCELTAGVNYYLHGHAAKFTVDVTWLSDGAPSGLGGLGFVESTEEQMVLRGQFQLLL